MESGKECCACNYTANSEDLSRATAWKKATNN